jgi:hypothetical protein
VEDNLKGRERVTMVVLKSDIGAPAAIILFNEEFVPNVPCLFAGVSYDSFMAGWTVVTIR